MNLINKGWDMSNKCKRVKTVRYLLANLNTEQPQQMRKIDDSKLKTLSIAASTLNIISTQVIIVSIVIYVVRGLL